MHTEDGVRAGLSPAEARRQALIRLGGVEQTRQAYRERRTLPWIEELLQDVRFGVRMMGRNRGFTAVAIVTLAIGIGATATAFTWINAVLLQPLSGVADPNRLVTLETVTPNGDWVPNSYPDFIDFRDRPQTVRRHCGGACVGASASARRTMRSACGASWSQGISFLFSG